MADGGTGVLLSAAVPGLRVPEEANIRAPEAVVSVHVSFINAGADLIETNSFGANRRKLAQHHLEDSFEAINSAAVKLAREAREITGREVLIGAAIGPSGDQRPGAVRRAGADPGRARRRPLRRRDVLRPRRARGRDRRGAIGVGAADRRADELRQRRGHDRRRVGARGGGADALARRRGVRREPRPRPGGGARCARRDVVLPARRWRRCRTSGSRRSAARGSRSRTRRRSTSASSPRARVRSARG